MLQWNHARRNRALLIAGLALLIVGMLWAARGALIPYIVALVLAYLMLPAVNWLERPVRIRLRLGHAARPVAIIVVYLVAAGLLALFVSLVVPVVTSQFEALWGSRIELLDQLQNLLNQSLTWYRENVPVQVQAQVDESLSRASGTLAAAVQTGATRTFGVVTNTVSFILGTLVIPFWMFYVLHDQSKAMDALHNMIPPRYWPDFRSLVRIIDTILGAYIRGQLLLCFSIGLMATIGLMMLGVRYSAVLGLIAGLTEFLPFIGPILGLVPAVIVATVQQPLLGLWTLLLFLGIQQVENVLLAPRISGGSVRLHPAIIMVVLVMGNEVAGLWGMLIAVPLTAVVRDWFRYLYLRFQDAPLPPAEALAAVSHGAEDRQRPRQVAPEGEPLL